MIKQGKDLNRTPIIGIDIGGVIISRSNDNTDTSFFGHNFLNTSAVEGAFDAIAGLAKDGFEVHLVSKCGANVEQKTRTWLAHHNFYEVTTVKPSDVHFCRERKDKAEICRKLSVTHFVDDRLEVLSYLESVDHLYLFNAVEAEVQKHSGHLRTVTRVEEWNKLADLVLATISVTA